MAIVHVLSLDDINTLRMTAMCSIYFNCNVRIECAGRGRDQRAPLVNDSSERLTNSLMKQVWYIGKELQPETGQTVL